MIPWFCVVSDLLLKMAFTFLFCLYNTFILVFILLRPVRIFLVHF